MDITYQQLITDSLGLCKQIEKDKYDFVYPIPVGGLLPAAVVSSVFGIPLVEEPREKTLVVDDIVDSGNTILKYKDFDTAVVYRKPHSPKTTYCLKEVNGWINMPHEKNKTGIEDCITRILEVIGENPRREGLLETPKRVASMYQEIFSGLTTPPPDLKLFESKNDQMIVKTFSCFSWCEHHLVPIEMKISIGYIPNGKVAGISKIIRRIKWHASRPIIQENFTENVADDFMELLKPKGVAVLVKGRHYCEILRGVKTESETITSALRKRFKKSQKTREEFFRLI